MGKRALARALGWALFVVLASAVVACGLVLGLKDGDYQGIGDAGDGGPPGDERPVLKPDASTATCEGVDGSFARNLVDDADSVFVLHGGSTIVSSCGSKLNPCGTIAVGVEVANANRAKAIFIGPGTYPEKLSIPSGVTVEGGFLVMGSEWTALCENITTIIAPPDAVAVEADNVLNASLRFLTVETKAHGDPGESLFGIYANASQLTLENVNVYAELAGPGSTGAAGTGNDTTDKSCGGGGSAGNPGAPGTAGAFTTTGYQPGSAGGVGASGARGAAGTHSSPQCSTTCIASCNTFTYPVDDAGVPIDDAGNELPDASPTECQSTTKSVCGADVSVACGGSGGLGGAGGGNGAASVAVFATGPSTIVTITGGALVSAGGGLGGPGGGGASGAGGDGANAGAGAACVGTCDSQCMEAISSTLNGGATTAGANGGAGGAGGGGAGGPTFLIVISGGANVTSSGTSQWQVPTAGAAGGQPNGPAGAFGKQSP